MNRAKQYMMEYTRLRKKITRLEERINEIEEQALKITSWSDGDRVQSSHNPDKIGQLVAKKLDLEAETLDEIELLMDKMGEIEAVLEQLRNPDFALLLQYHYIRGMTWEAISDKMHYSTRWIQTLHGRALREIDKLI